MLVIVLIIQPVMFSYAMANINHNHHNHGSQSHDHQKGQQSGSGHHAMHNAHSDVDLMPELESEAQADASLSADHASGADGYMGNCCASPACSGAMASSFLPESETATHDYPPIVNTIQKSIELFSEAKPPKQISA